MELSEYLNAERGRAKRMAARVGMSASFLSQIARRERPCPAEFGAAIEAASDYQVRRWELRPDDWRRIWPELDGAPGAPGRAAAAAPGTPPSAARSTVASRALAEQHGTAACDLTRWSVEPGNWRRFFPALAAEPERPAAPKSSEHASAPDRRASERRVHERRNRERRSSRPGKER